MEELTRQMDMLDAYDRQQEDTSAYSQDEAFEEALGRTHAHLQEVQLQREAEDAGYSSVESYLGSMESAE